MRKLKTLFGFVAILAIVAMASVWALWVYFDKNLYCHAYSRSSLDFWRQNRIATLHITSLPTQEKARLLVDGNEVCGDRSEGLFILKVNVGEQRIQVITQNQGYFELNKAFSGETYLSFPRDFLEGSSPLKSAGNHK